jgi:hypothetical protein
MLGLTPCSKMQPHGMLQLLLILLLPLLLQTPTLGFTVERHQAIVAFQPEPFWVVRPQLAKVGGRSALRVLQTVGVCIARMAPTMDCVDSEGGTKINTAGVCNLDTCICCAGLFKHLQTENRPSTTPWSVVPRGGSQQSEVILYPLPTLLYAVSILLVPAGR